MKPLLVGECNPYGADPHFALYPLPEHASGGRLARILGLSRTEYLRRFDRVNLCEGRWSLPDARQKASDIIHDDNPAIILLGSKVCAAFRFSFVPFRTFGRVYILPHPSGLCRVWNELGSVDRARELVAHYLL